MSAANFNLPPSPRGRIIEAWRRNIWDSLSCYEGEKEKQRVKRKWKGREEEEGKEEEE
jgi:hypothetical protein